MTQSVTFWLGDFQVSPSQMRIWGPSGEQRVQPKVMDLLVYLMSRPEQTVTRDELIQSVWRGVVVNDDSLNRAVKKLRKLLGDDPRNPSYIETIPKLGYRLLQTPVDKDPTESISASAEGIPSFVRNYALALVGVVAITAYFLLSALVPSGAERDTGISGASGSVVIAGITADQESAIVVQVIRTVLRQALGQAPTSYVLSDVAVQSVLRRMGKEPDSLNDVAVAREAAVRLGATAVVVGSVAKIADNFTVSLEVLDPNTGEQLFADSFPFSNPQRMLKSLNSVAQRATKSLAGSTPFDWKPAQDVTTSELPALEAFSKAERLMSEGSPEAALALLQEAVRIDPQFALAHARIATILLNEDRDPVRRSESLAKALANPARLSRRELIYIRATAARQHDASQEEEEWGLLTRLFPKDPEGHSNLGKMRWRYHNDFAGAAAHFRESLALVESSIVRFHLAYMLMGSGEIEEGLTEFRRAVEQSSSYFNGGMADALLLAGDTAAAREHLQAAQGAANDKYVEWAANKWPGVYLSAGELETALRVIDDQLRADVLTQQPNLARRKRRNSLLAAKAVVLERLGNPDFVAVLEEAIAGEQALLDGDFPPEEVQPVLRLAFLGKVAARAGRIERAQGLLATLRSHPRVGTSPLPLHRPSLAVLEGEIALARGETDEAIRRFASAARESSLLQHYESLATAYDASGRGEEARAAWQWIVDHRGQAAAEWYGDFYLKPRNLLDVQAARERLRVR